DGLSLRWWRQSGLLPRDPETVRTGWGAGGERVMASEWAARRAEASHRRCSVACELVEVGGGAFLHGGVHGVEVRAHRGGWVGVVEHLLDNEEVEVVGAVFVGGVVEDACGAAPKVVGAEVSEPRGCGAFADDLLHRAGAGDGVAP